MERICSTGGPRHCQHREATHLSCFQTTANALRMVLQACDKCSPFTLNPTKFSSATGYRMQDRLRAKKERKSLKVRQAEDSAKKRRRDEGVWGGERTATPPIQGTCYEGRASEASCLCVHLGLGVCATILNKFCDGGWTAVRQLGSFIFADWSKSAALVDHIKPGRLGSQHSNHDARERTTSTGLDCIVSQSSLTRHLYESPLKTTRCFFILIAASPGAKTKSWRSSIPHIKMFDTSFTRRVQYASCRRLTSER